MTENELNEKLAQAWDEGRAWARAEAHREYRYHRSRAGTFGTPACTNKDIQPYRDALDAVDGPNGVTEYNYFISSIMAMSITESLTHFEGNEEYEGDEEKNPYRKDQADDTGEDPVSDTR